MKPISMHKMQAMFNVPAGLLGLNVDSWKSEKLPFRAGFGHARW